MSNLDSFSIPMTMGDWALIMESIATKLREMEAVDPDTVDEDELADIYTDQQNLESLFKHIKIEFEKKYGSLPSSVS